MAHTLSETGSQGEGPTTLNILHYNPTIDAGSRGQMSARFSSQPPPINAQPISYYPYTYGSSGMPEAFLQQQPSPSVSRPVSSSSVQSHPWKPVQAQATFLRAPPSQKSQPSLSIRVPGLLLSPAEHEMDEFSLGGQMTPRSMTDLSAQCSPHKILVRTSDNGQSGRASGFNRGMAHYREHSFAYSSTAFTSANTLITPPLTPGFDATFQPPILPLVQEGLISHQQHPSVDFLNFPLSQVQTPNPPLLVLPSQPLSTSSAPYSTSIPITIGDTVDPHHYTGPSTPRSTVAASGRLRPLESALSQQTKSTGQHSRSKSSVQRAQICQNPRFSSVTETLSPPDEDYRFVFHGEEFAFSQFSLALSAYAQSPLSLGSDATAVEPFPSFVDELEPLEDEDLTDSRSSRSDSSSLRSEGLTFYNTELPTISWKTEPSDCQQFLSSAFSGFAFPKTEIPQPANKRRKADKMMNGQGPSSPALLRGMGTSPRPRKLLKEEASDDVSHSIVSNEAIHPDLLAQSSLPMMSMSMPMSMPPQGMAMGTPMSLPEHHMMVQMSSQPMQQNIQQSMQQTMQQNMQQSMQQTIHQMPQHILPPSYQMNVAPIAPMSLPNLDHQQTPYTPGTPINQPTPSTVFSNLIATPGTPTDIPRPPQNHHTNHSGQLSLRGRKSSLTHDPTKIYPCEHCERRFRRQEHLKRHVRTVHENAKPFPCPDCGKIFGRNDNLKQHMRTHGTGNASGMDTSSDMMASAVTPSANLSAHPYGNVEGGSVMGMVMQMGNNPLNLSDTLLKAAKNAGGDHVEGTGLSSGESGNNDPDAQGAKRGRGRGGRGGAPSTRKPATKRKREIGDVDGREFIYTEGGAEAAITAALDAQVQAEAPLAGMAPAL